MANQRARGTAAQTVAQRRAEIRGNRNVGVTNTSDAPVPTRRSRSRPTAAERVTEAARPASQKRK